MSGWLKVEKATPAKPEIAILARLLGVSVGDAFLQWFLVYSWADGATANGDVRGLTLDEVDRQSHAMPGTCAALASMDIEWMAARGATGVRFNKWDRHNGNSAKARALEAEAKRLRRADEVSDNVGQLPDALSDQTRGDERRREDIRTNSERQDSVRRKPDGPTPFDLSGMTDGDWSDVVALAEAVAKRVPPKTVNDRRQWLKFAVIAHRGLGEHWMLDSAEAVKQAKETRKTRQAHFVAVLKSQAEKDHGLLPDDLRLMCKRVDIPAHVWKSDFLPVREVSHGK